MATSSSSAMKTSLVLMLLLSAVVASLAHQVSVRNTCGKPVRVNDIWLDVDALFIFDVVEFLEFLVFDVKGVEHYGKYKCPEYVKALKIVYVDGCMKLKTTAISSVVAGLVQTVLGVLSTVIATLNL